MKLDFGKLTLGGLLSGFVRTASAPFYLLPPLVCLLLLALSAELRVPLEDLETDTSRRVLLISFGYLALPATALAAWLFGVSVPAILLALLPLSVIEISVTPTLTLGPGADMSGAMLIVACLTVYIREGDILARPFRCAPCAAAALGLMIFYFVISFGYAAANLSIWIGGGMTPVLMIVLALLMRPEPPGLLSPGLWRLVVILTAVLFLNQTGIFMLLLEGDPGGLGFSFGGARLNMQDWLRFLIVMVLAGLFARLIRDELWQREGRLADGALLGLLAACLFFYLFRYHVRVGFELTLPMRLSVPVPFVFLAAGLVGYRMGRTGVVWAGVLMTALILIAYVLHALVLADSSGRIDFIDGVALDEVRLRSRLLVTGAAPLPLLLTALACAWGGSALARRIRSLRTPAGDKFLRSLGQ